MTGRSEAGLRGDGLDDAQWRSGCQQSGAAQAGSGDELSYSSRERSCPGVAASKLMSINAPETGVVRLAEHHFDDRDPAAAGPSLPGIAAGS